MTTSAIVPRPPRRATLPRLALGAVLFSCAWSWSGRGDDGAILIQASRQLISGKQATESVDFVQPRFNHSKEALESDERNRPMVDCKAEELAVMHARLRPSSYLLSGERPRRQTSLGNKLLTPMLLRNTAGQTDLAGQAFRTKTCEEVPGLNEMNIGKARFPDGNMKVMDHLTLAPPAEETAFKPKLACLVYGYSGGRQELLDSYATWGQDCDSFLAISDETFRFEGVDLETIEVHAHSGVQKDLIGKLKAAFQEVGRRLDAGTLDFDFITVSGDDAFWITPNVRKMLRTGEVLKKFQSGEGMLLGRKFVPGHPDKPTGESFPSGAGYILDKVALRAYLEGKCQNVPPQGGWWEDVFLSGCLRRSSKKIEVYEPRDDKNGMLFHPFSASQMLGVNYQSGGWFTDYEKEMLPIPEGMDGISPDSVLFHYSEGQLRYNMHDRLLSKLVCAGSNHSMPELD